MLKPSDVALFQKRMDRKAPKPEAKKPPEPPKGGKKPPPDFPPKAA